MIASPVNMNNANAYSELTARTQFILDRVAFLKDVGVTLMDEGTPAADAKINVWLSNAYVPLIVRCIKSDEEPVRAEALWTVANMLGADTAAVREATKNAMTQELLKSVLDYVFLESKDTVGCAAFLLSNYARFKNISYAEAQNIVYSACAKGIITNGKAATDLLWAANYAADKFPAAIPLSLVINTLGDTSINKDKARLLRRLLGLAAEQNGLVHANLLGPVITVLERLLEGAKGSGVRAELFWILSNVLTEPGAPEIFFGHKTLLQEVIDESTLASKSGLQATYALANFVTMVADPVIQESLAHGPRTMSMAEAFGEYGYAFDIYDQFYQLSFSEDAQLRALGAEGFAALLRYADIYYPEIPEDEDEDEDDDDDDDDATLEVDTEDDYYYDASGVKMEIEESIKVTTTAPVIAAVPVTAPAVPMARMEENIAPVEADKNEWHVRVPCAYELLYGSDRASCESRTVRTLVSLVERAMSDPDVEGDGWVKVPLDTVLSVGDLVTLQHMGYVFDGEWLGVNPTIYNGY
jgi:hypothetical protein